MKRRIVYMTVSILFGLMTAQPAAPAVPRFSTTTLYKEVRTRLLAAGWQPYPIKTDFHCDEDNCQGAPEVIDCAYVGRAPCIYLWRKKTHALLIWAVGEGDQYFDTKKECPTLRVRRAAVAGLWACG